MHYYGELIRRSWRLLLGYPGFVALGLRTALARNITNGLILSGYWVIVGFIAILLLYLLYARAIASLIAGVARIEEDGESMSLRMMWAMGEVWTWAVFRVIAAIWLIPSLVVTTFTIVTHSTLFGTGG